VMLEILGPLGPPVLREVGVRSENREARARERPRYGNRLEGGSCGAGGD
jgi:hypothetical protein